MQIRFGLWPDTTLNNSNFRVKYRNPWFLGQKRVNVSTDTNLYFPHWSAADQIHDQSEARLSTKSHRNELIAVLQTILLQIYVSINIGSTIIEYLRVQIIAGCNRLD